MYSLAEHNPETWLNHIFKDAARRYGCPKPLDLKGLRHTHATLLLLAGVHFTLVSARLGHTSHSTTLNIYTHFVPSLEGEAANTFDKIIDKGEDIFVRSHDEVAELVDQIVDES